MAKMQRNWANRLKSPAEAFTQGAGKLFYEFTTRNHFNVQMSGEENLEQVDSGVIALNHCMCLDGIFTCLKLPKMIHYLIQYENVCNKNWKNEVSRWAVGFIPVSLGELDAAGNVKKETIDYSMNIRAIKRGVDYLRTRDDLVGVFIDGAARTLKSEGRITALEDRNTEAGGALAVWMAIQAQKPIIPVGLWMPDPERTRLFEYGGKEENHRQYVKNRICVRAKHNEDPRIPYQINIGTPIFPLEIERMQPLEKKAYKQSLAEQVQREIIRLSKPRD